MICIQNPKSARSAAATALYGIFSSENFYMWTLTAGIIRCQHHAEFSIRKISTPKGPIHLSFLFSFQVPVKLRSRLSRDFSCCTDRTAPNDHSVSEAPADVIDRLIHFLLLFTVLRVFKEGHLAKLIRSQIRERHPIRRSGSHFQHSYNSFFTCAKISSVTSVGSSKFFWCDLVLKSSVR